jgi:hypothetical protein
MRNIDCCKRGIGSEHLPQEFGFVRSATPGSGRIGSRASLPLLLSIENLAPAIELLEVLVITRHGSTCLRELSQRMALLNRALPEPSPPSAPPGEPRSSIRLPISVVSGLSSAIPPRVDRPLSVRHIAR